MLTALRKLFVPDTAKPAPSPAKPAAKAGPSEEDFQRPESAQTGVVDADRPLSTKEAAWVDEVEAKLETGKLKAELAPASSVQRQLLSVIDSPQLPMKKVARSIQSDPALAGEVLKMANSSLFGGCGGTSSLEQATVRLGQRQLRLLLMTVMLESRVARGPAVEVFSQLQWRHSLACGRIAAHLARKSGLDPDDAYLSGLFHNVGVLALLGAIGGEEPRRARPRAVVELILRRAYGLNKEVVVEWKLPHDVADAAQRYRDYSQFDYFNPLAAVVSLANDVCKRYGLWTQQRCINLEAHPALRLLGQGPEIVPPQAAVMLMANKVSGM